MNGIYDPYQTGGGHQPQGRDQWATFYNRYRVEGCHVTATWTSTSAAGSLCSLMANNDVTNITDAFQVIESQISSTKGIASGGPAVKISKYYDLAALNGVTRQRYESDDRYQATMTANPTETLCVHVGLFNLASVTYQVIVKMEFYTTMFDPIQLASS